MTPEQLKEGKRFEGEIDFMAKRLEQLEAWRERCENGKDRKRIVFGVSHQSMEILSHDKDLDLIDTVVTLAVARITTHLEDLKKRFEAL